MGTSNYFKLGKWRVDPTSNTLQSDTGEHTKIEPLSMNLLLCLVAAQGAVVSRQALFEALWPDVVVAEDTLARAVSRLRKALGDTSSESKFIETIPKRGYRLLLPVHELPTPKESSAKRRTITIALLAISLLVISLVAIWRTGLESGITPHQATLEQAQNLYMNFNRADNESAMALFESVLAIAPENQAALAGVANCLVQRLVRWPNGTAIHQPSIAHALATEQLSSGSAIDVLRRAQMLAERAVRIAPSDPASLKALGFVYSAQGKLDSAKQMYEEAIDRDPLEWRSLINLGEIYTIEDDLESAVATFSKAYYAMQERYDSEPQRIGPWQAALGVVIAQQWVDLNRPVEAEKWYRTVLSQVPLQRDAVMGLVALLHRNGRSTEAAELCQRFESRLESLPVCSGPAGEL